MKSRTTKQAAFTLIEVVITVFISTVIATAIVSMYLEYTKTFTIQQTYIDVALSANDIVNAIDAAGRQADSIVLSHTFSGTTYTTGTTTVVFEIPSVDSSGDIIAGTYDYVGIYASSTAAYYVFDPGSGSARTEPRTQLSSILQGLTLVYNNSNVTAATKLDVYATTSAVVQNQTVLSHLHQQVYLRNK